MTEKKNENRIKGQIKSRILVGLVLLCVSVVLLAVLIPTGVTYAKYVRELFDFTGAVAGDFHFSSNYLEEDTTKLYTINDWDGGTYSFDLEIYNFDNSLRYNDDGLDCYYYLDTKVSYKDDNGEWIEKDADKYTITYTVKGQVTRQDENGNEKKEVVDLVDNDVAGEYALTYLLTEKDNDNQITRQILCPAIKLPSMNGSFDKTAGTHKVSVMISFTEDQVTPHDLVITARSIPYSQLENIRNTSYETTSTEKFEDVNNNKTKYPVLTETDYNGVYSVGLSCEVDLEQTVRYQTVSASYRRVDDNNKQLTYLLKCASSESSSITNVRVYFNSQRIEADPNLLTDEFPKATVTTDGTTVPMEDENCDIRYFDTTVQSSCVRELVFYTEWYAKDDAKEGTNHLVIPQNLLEGSNTESYKLESWLTDPTSVPDIWFEILDKDAETCTLTITQPEGASEDTGGVTVKKQGEDTALATGATVKKGDVLVITYNGGTVTVNGEEVANGGSYTVGTEDINVAYTAAADEPEET